MAEKPSYLGLLNAISLAEGRAGEYLRAWAETTTDPDVGLVISTVAIREAEHGLAFEKRICELGFAVRDRPDAEFEKRMAIAKSGMSDLEKFQALGLVGSDDGGKDPFADMFSDESIDIQTGELLGRYIAEERDSGRMLRGCCEVLQRRSGGGNGASPDVSLQDLCVAVEALTSKVDGLQRNLAELQGARA